MSRDHAATNGIPKPFTPPRSTDERGRLLPIGDEQRRSRIEEGNRALDQLAEMTDETDTPELWDEVIIATTNVEHLARFPGGTRMVDHHPMRRREKSPSILPGKEMNRFFSSMILPNPEKLA